MIKIKATSIPKLRVKIYLKRVQNVQKIIKKKITTKIIDVHEVQKSVKFNLC